MSDKLRLVINHILDRTICENQTKLHILLYYCHAWSLVETGVGIIDEVFVADVNGPRCLELDDIICIIDRVKYCPMPVSDVL